MNDLQLAGALVCFLAAVCAAGALAWRATDSLFNAAVRRLNRRGPPTDAVGS